MNWTDLLVWAMLIVGILLVTGPAIVFLVSTVRRPVAFDRRMRIASIMTAGAPAMIAWLMLRMDDRPPTWIGVLFAILAGAVLVRAATTPSVAGAPPVRTRIRYSVLAILVAAYAHLAVASVPSQRSRYTTALRSDLRNLVADEEAYFDSAHQYSADLRALGYRSSIGTRGPFITLTDSGFTATNGHTAIESLSCAIAVKAKNPLDATVPSGEPACVAKPLVTQAGTPR